MATATLTNPKDQSQPVKPIMDLFGPWSILQADLSQIIASFRDLFAELDCYAAEDCTQLPIRADIVRRVHFFKTDMDRFAARYLSDEVSHPAPVSDWVTGHQKTLRVAAAGSDRAYGFARDLDGAMRADVGAFDLLMGAILDLNAAMGAVSAAALPDGVRGSYQ